MTRDAHATGVFILTFSDLISEPPTTSWATCAARSGEPPDVDWSALNRAALGFYFVSTDFRLRPAVRWAHTLEQHGLRGEFMDAAQTMSQELELKPPAPAVYRPTTEEVRQASASLDRLKDGAMSALTYGLTALGTVIAALVGVVVIFTRRRRPAARQA
jgi:hypothetical protein